MTGVTTKIPSTLISKTKINESLYGYNTPRTKILSEMSLAVEPNQENFSSVIKPGVNSSISGYYEEDIDDNDQPKRKNIVRALSTEIRPRSVFRSISSNYLKRKTNHSYEVSGSDTKSLINNTIDLHHDANSLYQRVQDHDFTDYIINSTSTKKKPSSRQFRKSNLLINLDIIKDKYIGVGEENIINLESNENSPNIKNTKLIEVSRPDIANRVNEYEPDRIKDLKSHHKNHHYQVLKNTLKSENKSSPRLLKQARQLSAEIKSFRMKIKKLKGSSCIINNSSPYSRKTEQETSVRCNLQSRSSYSHIFTTAVKPAGDDRMESIPQPEYGVLTEHFERDKRKMKKSLKDERIKMNFIDNEELYAIPYLYSSPENSHLLHSDLNHNNSPNQQSQLSSPHFHTTNSYTTFKNPQSPQKPYNNPQSLSTNFFPIPSIDHSQPETRIISILNNSTYDHHNSPHRHNINLDSIRNYGSTMNPDYFAKHSNHHVFLQDQQNTFESQSLTRDLSYSTQVMDSTSRVIKYQMISESTNDLNIHENNNKYKINHEDIEDDNILESSYSHHSPDQSNNFWIASRRKSTQRQDIADKALDSTIDESRLTFTQKSMIKSRVSMINPTDSIKKTRRNTVGVKFIL